MKDVDHITKLTLFIILGYPNKFNKKVEEPCESTSKELESGNDATTDTGVCTHIVNTRQLAACI